MENSLDRKITKGMLLRFSLPTIISMIFMSIYTTVDGVFVSRLVGTDALSAVNIVLPLITVAIALGTMIGTGGSAIVARKMGEGKASEARQDFSLLFCVGCVTALVFSLAGFLFLDPVLKFLGADAKLYPFCVDYAETTLLFLPFSVFAIMFQVFFVTAGKASLSLVLSACGGVCNMILDYVFISIFEMGIRGAALATGIGYLLPSAVGFCYFSFCRTGTLYFVKPAFRGNTILHTFGNGSSEMVTNLSMGVVTILLNNILMRMCGSDGVASITIILYAQGIMTAAYIGYALGIAPLVSFNYGKGDTARLKKIHRISLGMILISSVVILLASELFAGPLVAIFSPKGTKVYSMAVRGFRLFSAGFLFMGYNIYGSAVFTALSNGKISAVLSFLRTLVFVVASALLLPMALQTDGVWLSIPLAELLGFLLTFFFLHRFRKTYGYA